jgi:two-component system OmpR family response regulator
MRVLVVEDDDKIASFVVKGLRAEGWVAEHARNGSQGLDLALAGGFDAAVVDLMLPGRDGLSVIRELRAQGVSMPIIILSARDAIDDRVRGLQAGSDDYLTKPFAFSELLARLQALARRASGGAEPTRLTVADVTLDRLSREVWRGGRRIDLQPLEFSLLEYLMRNAGRVVSKTMIMEHVWNYSFDPMTNVVESRICRLRDKLDRGADRPLIHTVRGVGYTFKPPAAKA